MLRLSLLLAFVASAAAAQPGDAVVLAGEVTSSSAILHARGVEPDGYFVVTG